jgi:hypothetical protein
MLTKCQHKGSELREIIAVIKTDAGSLPWWEKYVAVSDGRKARILATENTESTEKELFFRRTYIPVRLFSLTV